MKIAIKKWCLILSFLIKSFKFSFFLVDSVPPPPWKILKWGLNWTDWKLQWWGYLSVQHKWSRRFRSLSPVQGPQELGHGQGGQFLRIQKRVCDQWQWLWQHLYLGQEVGGCCPSCSRRWRRSCQCSGASSQPPLPGHQWPRWWRQDLDARTRDDRSNHQTAARIHEENHSKVSFNKIISKILQI